MATDVLTVNLKFDKENALNCIKNVLLDEYGMTMNELDRLVNAKQEGRLREDVRGEWEIVEGSNRKEYMVCTNCRVTQNLTALFTFCPNCGARMAGGGER